MLKRWRQVPGINGIKGLRGGGISETAARAKYVDDGWIFINPEECEWLDNQPNDSGYLRAIEGKYGTVWVDIFAEPESIGAGNNASVVFSRDKEAYNDFRRELLNRGVVPAIQAGVVKLYSKRQRSRASRKISQIHNPMIAKHIENESTKLSQMQASVPTKRSKKIKKGVKNA
tara:strand:- start:701 stop:1219 length:519 start_codon:yes stop_codon:yes gene_type:complete